MTRHILHIISGIPPGSSGTGRLLAHLLSEKDAIDDWQIFFHFPYRPVGSIREMIHQGRLLTAGYSTLYMVLSWLFLIIKLRWLSVFSSGNILIFHPQTLGFRRTLRLIRVWNNRAYLFGLDNSFFCVRSYNYILGETRPCLRCLGGRFQAAKEQGCKSFPVSDGAAYTFVRNLFKYLLREEVCVLAQNVRNAELYRRHIGDNVHVEVVGLWTSDWTELFESPATAISDDGYDVVYHGHFVPAKGAEWLLEVAHHLPGVRFLFPTSLPRHIHNPPKNITFKSMTWETGLDTEVARAKIVCVPSLWSATIEGALVKSIMFANATARVNVESAYGDELPEGLVLNLDPDPATAAHQLAKAIENRWKPDTALYETWLNNFRKENYNLLRRLLGAIERSVKQTIASASSSKTNQLIQTPVSNHGLRLEKLGTSYGGWTVPVELIDQNWICYCIGAGEDISFDCALIERFSCNVFTLDPTPRAIEHVTELINRTRSEKQMPVNNNPDVLYSLPAEKLNHLNFYPYGVWSKNITQRFYAPSNSAHVSHSILNLQHTEDYFDAVCHTLTSLMHEFGHTRIDLLKLDVEGAEYEILRSMLVDDIKPRVLCIEFDEGNLPLDKNAPERISEIINKLQNSGFVFVHQEGWNMMFIHRGELTSR